MLLGSDVFGALRPPRCELCDLRCVLQEHKDSFLSAEHETSVCSLWILNAAGPQPEFLYT